jgi:hypothetical protein
LNIYQRGKVDPMIEDEYGAAMEMPRYKSHKTVWALEIDTITPRALQAPIMTFRDEGYAPIDDAPPEMFSRYTPVPGDFYVQYEDGYKSFSPRKAFLGGYTRENT